MATPNRFPVLGVLSAFCLGLFLGLGLARWFGTGPGPRHLSTPAILEQVKTLADFVTVEYTLEKVESLEVPAQNLVGQVLGSENRVLMLAHGTVKAGIDLKRLGPGDISVSGKSITIKLPAAKITDAYLDENLSRVIDRKTGLLAPPDKDLEQTVRQIAIDDIRRAAREGGIAKAAEDRARTQLGRLLLQLGFEKVEFKLDQPVIGGGVSTPDR